MKRFFLILVVLLMGASFVMAGGRADDRVVGGVSWPRNITIVVPAGPGGDTDFNARTLAPELTRRLPSNFVVANVTGGGGGIGMRQVMNAASDGSSVAFFHTAFVVGQRTGTVDFGFDAFEFASIAARNPGNAVTVRTELGINTLQELYAFTQANPGQLRIGVEFGGTSFAIASMMEREGFLLNIVDAGSAAERLMALLGGHVDVILAGYGSVADFITEGTLTALAMDGGADLVAGNVRVPSLVSEGFDVSLPFYYFFAFPKGTDRALINAFNEALEDIIMNNPEYARSIYSAFFQQPTFFDTTEGLAIYDRIYRSLAGIFD